MRCSVKSKLEKRGSGSVGYQNVRLDKFLKRSGVGLGCCFQIILVCKLLHVSFRICFIFLVNGSEQMLALLVQSYKSGGGEKGPKKCSSAMFYLKRCQVIRKFHRFFFLASFRKKNYFRFTLSQCSEKTDALQFQYRNFSNMKALSEAEVKLQTCICFINIVTSFRRINLFSVIKGVKGQKVV